MSGNFGWMEPNLFFFPNGSFYGGVTRITVSLIMNHAIWIIAVIFGAFRAVTPFITGNGDRRKVLVELLVSGVFIFSVVAYVEFFPLKHSQYLIPIAIFIAYYFADALVFVLRFLDRYIPFFGSLALILIASYYVVTVNREVNIVKLGWNNKVQLIQMKMLVDSVSPSTEVLDLEGRMLFWKDAYYICCVPIGSFVQYMSSPPPALRDVLEAKKTPYIYQGDSNRLSLFSPADLEYITRMYTPVPGWGETFWKRK
jgi:hypothetical protein